MAKMRKVLYKNLNSRQQENYNFQKVSAHLADYGFNCLRLSDDWNGADFIACHIDGIKFLKVQLKGRLTFDKKYFQRDIHIAFNDAGTWYLYPHDELLGLFLSMGKLTGTKSWDDDGGYSWGTLSKEIKEVLKPYVI